MNVLVTGTNGHLGAHVVKALLDHGDTVYRAEDYFQAEGLDLTLPDRVDFIVADVLSKAGRIDALVHLVGGYAGGARVEDTMPEVFDAMMKVNYFTTVNMVHAVLPSMVKQGSGSIVAISARTVYTPQLNVAYAMSKSAVMAFLMAVAGENNGRIQCYCPTPVVLDTDQRRDDLSKAIVNALAHTEVRWLV